MYKRKMAGTAGFWTAVTFILGTAISIGDFKWPLGAIVLYAITACLIVYGAVELWLLPMSFGRRLQAFWRLRFGGFMSLNAATKLAYEEARAHKTLWAVAAERGVQRTPQGILDYVACYFGMNVPIYGARPPSARPEEIPSNVASHGSYSGGASRLTFQDAANTEFVDLQVRVRDVRSMLKRMADKPFENGLM